MTAPETAPNTTAWPSTRWIAGWAIAIALVLIPFIGPVTVFVLWHLAWIPAYFATKALGLQHGNWVLLIALWGGIAFMLSLAGSRHGGARSALWRAALTAIATIVLLEASAVTLCRINERNRPEGARTCYPHVAGWHATEHLRQRTPLKPATP